MIKDENYIVIQGWMINNLPLDSMNEVMIFAAIYGFCQDGESKFTGSLRYLSEITKTSKPTTIKIIKNLVEKQLIIKHEQVINGVQFNQYSVNLLVVKNFNQGSKETLPWVVKNFNQGSKETLPNNTNYIIDNKIDKNNIVNFDFNGFNDLEIKAIEKWLQYKKERGQAYKGKSGITALRNKLLDYKTSGQNIRLLIDKSMASNWSGIFADNSTPKGSYHTMGDFTGQEPGETAF